MPSRDEAREKTRAWVQAVIRHTHTNASTLARKAGLVPSTLNRFLNDAGYAGDLSRATLDKIAEVTGIPPLVMPDAPRGRASSGALEAVQLDGGAVQLLDDSIRIGLADLIRAHQHVHPWMLQSAALAGAGYLPGDVLIVDLAERARARDVVCAQIYDYRGEAETVFRVYEPPYLLAVTADPSLLRVHVVDDDACKIRGVVVGSLRARRSASLAA